MCDAQMQLPFHGQSAGMPARMPSSSDIPRSFLPVAYGNDTSMDNLDYLGNVGLFPPQQSESMPDYSDLNRAASQMQVSIILPSRLQCGEQSTAGRGSALCAFSPLADHCSISRKLVTHAASGSGCRFGDYLVIALGS